jgi:hypothetical protein
VLLEWLCSGIGLWEGVGSGWGGRRLEESVFAISGGACFGFAALTGRVDDLDRMAPRVALRLP